MSELAKLRHDMEKLHEDLLQLILKRKRLVDQIWQLKREDRLSLTDANREQDLIEQFDHLSEFKNDPALRDFYHDVVKNIIANSKSYAQKRMLVTKT